MRKLLKIYGERNTNTNYLSELVRLNLVIDELPGVVSPRVKRLQDKCPGHEWLRDLYFTCQYRQTLGWKHAAVNWQRLTATSLYETNDVTVVTLTKNPYAWLLSLYKRPYHQYGAKKLTFTEFISSPWRTVRREGVSRWVESPVHLWNVKNSSYLNAGSVRRILNLRAEDTLIDPQRVVECVAEVADVSRVGSFRNVLNSTKDGGKDFRYYQEYYLGERWREELDGADIKIINQRLDAALMEKFEYSFLK